MLKKVLLKLQNYTGFPLKFEFGSESFYMIKKNKFKLLFASLLLTGCCWRCPSADQCPICPTIPPNGILLPDPRSSDIPVIVKLDPNSAKCSGPKNSAPDDSDSDDDDGDDPRTSKAEEAKHRKAGFGRQRPDQVSFAVRAAVANR